MFCKSNSRVVVVFSCYYIIASEFLLVILLMTQYFCLVFDIDNNSVSYTSYATVLKRVTTIFLSNMTLWQKFWGKNWKNVTISISYLCRKNVKKIATWRLQIGKACHTRMCFYWTTIFMTKATARVDGKFIYWAIVYWMISS